MSPSSPDADLGDPGAAFCAMADEALQNSKPDVIADEILQRVFSAAVRLYCAKRENRSEELAPFGDRPVNATEAVTAVCAMMRAADLNFFDLQMWYGRARNQS